MNLSKKMKKIKKNVLIGLQETMDKEVLNRVKKHNITGRLERNTNTRIEGDSVISKIDDNGMMIDTKRGRRNYGIFVHFGTRPHIIKQKNKKSLRYAVGGKFRFSKKVKHPGYKGDPFLYDALKATLKKVEKIKKQAIREL